MAEFGTYAQDRVQADKLQAPKVARDQRRDNIEGALEQARQHLNVIQHNPLAVKRQHVIIARYEQQLAEINNQEWLK